MIKYLCVIFTVALTACATNPLTNTGKNPGESIDTLLANGGEEVDGAMLGLVGEHSSGFTLVDVAGTWRSYVGAQGALVTQIVSDETKKNLSWRVNEIGQFCQIGYVSGNEECEDESMRIIKTTGNTYMGFTDGDKSWEVTLEAGNPYDL